MKRVLSWWIRQRHNPQLGIYYVPHGQMPVKMAMRYERGSLYGDNVMLRFSNQEEYDAKIKALKDAGERVQP